MDATKDTFFKPGKVSARDKLNATDEAARAIIDAEANARERKTEALRALRLQQEATDGPAEEKKAKAAPKKTVRRGRC